LWGVDQTADLVKEAREINDRLRAITVLNEADPQGKDNQAAIDALKEVQGIELAPMLIIRRKAFPTQRRRDCPFLNTTTPRQARNSGSLPDFYLYMQAIA